MTIDVGGPASARPAFRETLARWRTRVVPDHLVGELLGKRWIDNAIPLLLVAATIAVFGALIPHFFSAQNLADAARQLGEFALVVIGLNIVMLGGGIDLSVGASFALCALVALDAVDIQNWPVWACCAAAATVGGGIGLLNGILVGYLRLRAFLTTLVTLIMMRSVYQIGLTTVAMQIQTSGNTSETWDAIGEGSILGIPVSFVIAACVAALAHVVMSRSRLGWRIQAVGGSRRSATNIGVPVRRTVCASYVIAGVLVGLSGFLFATRLGGIGADTGIGLEITALTACIVGGNAIGGGRGSIAKGLMGSVVVLVLTNGLVRLGFQSGAGQAVLGAVLTGAVVLDVRWLKNRGKVLHSTYVAPVYRAMPAPPQALPGSGAPYALNDRLASAEPIALGAVEGPEDIILDDDDVLYSGSRDGDIIRYFPPDYQKHEVFAHTGGFPLGMAFDRDGRMRVCVGGMGLYSVSRDGTVTKDATQARRSRFTIRDDSRLRDANDCDVSPDGRVFFTDSTTRYDTYDWAIDGVENRATGRVLSYDPKTGLVRTVLNGFRYTNGLCMARDGQSFFFAESFASRVHRYWFAGPRTGDIECVISNMPGYPDNINRASDGNYWLAWFGMRTPSFDLSLRWPAMRRRMTRRLPQNEWLFPNINAGGVLKFNERGEIIETLSDLTGRHHPMVTSMREHRGWLYVGGILNNRIGRVRLRGADPEWTGPRSYWGQHTP